MEKRVTELKSKEDATWQDWSMLKMYETEQWEQYEKMLTKQRLVDLMQQFKKQDTLNEFWRDVTPQQKEESLDKIIMSFDLNKNEVKLQSEKKNVNGAPLFEWTLESETGEIVEATRHVDAITERIIERQVNPSTLVNAEVQKALEKIESHKPELVTLEAAKPEGTKETTPE